MECSRLVLMEVYLPMFRIYLCRHWMYWRQEVGLFVHITGQRWVLSVVIVGTPHVFTLQRKQMSKVSIELLICKMVFRYHPWHRAGYWMQSMLHTAFTVFRYSMNSISLCWCQNDCWIFRGFGLVNWEKIHLLKWWPITFSRGRATNFPHPSMESSPVTVTGVSSASLFRLWVFGGQGIMYSLTLLCKGLCELLLFGKNIYYWWWWYTYFTRLVFCLSSGKFKAPYMGNILFSISHQPDKASWAKEVLAT